MSKEQKIDNTFNRVMNDVDRLQKAFHPGKNLEKAIAEVGGDIAWLKDINEAFDKLNDMLEEGHMGAVAHLQTDEACSSSKKKKMTEGVLDSDDDDGFMARSQLYFLARDAIKLHSVIDDRDDLEPWVASKIAQASKDMDSVRRYTEYNAMKAEIEPEMQPAPEVEALEEDPSKPKFPQGVPLEGDSIWLNRDGMQYADNVVTVTDVKTDESDNMIEVWVYHTAPWEIYTDSGFAKAISDMLGIEVDWSEQGMQADGVAHLEGELGLDEAIVRPVRSAASKLNQIGQGVRNKTNDETPASVGEGKYGKKKKKYKEAVKEETKFDDKPEHSELKTVAQDMFKHALANAKKKARK